MAEGLNAIKYKFHGYPEPKEGPDTGYIREAGSNPIVRGIPLAIAGSACVQLTSILISH